MDQESRIKIRNNERAATVAPAPRNYVIPGLTAGKVGILAGPGGTRKSLFALQAACAVACPHPGANLLGLDIKHHGPAMFITAEDDGEELDRRFYYVCQAMPASAVEHLYDDRLLRRASLIDDAPSLLSRKWQRDIAEAAEGCRLVVIDTLACFTPGVEENSNNQIAEVVAAAKRLASYTGAAVLLITHHGKAPARNDANAIRGASALVDGVRYAASMTPLLPEGAAKFVDSGEVIGADRAKHYVRYTTVKGNYGLWREHWFRSRTDDDDPENGVGVLVPADVMPAAKAITKPASKTSDGYDDLFGVKNTNVRSFPHVARREAK